MPHNPYTGVHNPGVEFTNPSPYSPEPLVVAGGWRTPAGQSYEMVNPDAGEGPVQASEGLPKSARRGGIKYPTGGVILGNDTICHSSADSEPVTLPDGTTIGYAMATAEAAGVPLAEEQARAYIDATKRDPEEGTRMVSLHKLTTEVMYDTSVTTTEVLYGDLPRHRVEEVSLEVPVPHGTLTYALDAVDATIAARRRFGYTIPEESRTVTTVGNEIIIRWEEHS